jgi:hypothetical protein
MCVSSWAPWLPQGASTQLAPALFCRLNGELMIRQKAGFRSIATHQLAQDIQLCGQEVRTGITKCASRY